jgi:hypothetical protein
MSDFGVRFERVPLMCDNTSAISVAKNPVFHKKMRHVKRRHHFLRDHVEKGDIEMRYIDTERQLALKLQGVYRTQSCDPPRGLEIT